MDGSDDDDQLLEMNNVSNLGNNQTPKDKLKLRKEKGCRKPVAN